MTSLRTNAKKATGPFPTRPGKYVTDKFIECVRDTGRPDLWEHHEPSPPPPDAEFEVLLEFSIPEKLRPDVGMATCPICSPASPKYFKGVLTHFPAEGVLRAIGNECAHGHFGIQRTNRARALGRRNQEIERQQEFLLNTLGKIPRLISDVRAAARIVRTAEMLKRRLWEFGGKSDWQSVARSGAAGFLEIVDVFKVDSQDAFGKSSTSYDARVQLSVRVAGLGYVGAKGSLEGLVRQTLQALEMVETIEDDEQAVLDFVVGLGDGQDLTDAYRLTRSAVATAHRLEAMFEEIRHFLTPENLAGLADWVNNPKSGVAFSIDYDLGHPARIVVHGPRRHGRPLPIPAELLGLRLAVPALD